MQFRDLTANEIDARVGQVGDGYFTLLLYKDARVDMDILDESKLLWQRKHYEVKGNLFCSVGVWHTEAGEWVWRDDCGTESNTEKEKGEASDSFKRACVNWGIGRELYTSPKIFINCDCKKGNNNLPWKDFEVQQISIDNKVITGLSITAYNKDSRTREVIFSHGKCKKSDYAPSEPVPAPPLESPDDNPICEDCGNPIRRTEKSTAKQAAEATKKITGKKLCHVCFKAARAAQEGEKC